MTQVGGNIAEASVKMQYLHSRLRIQNNRAMKQAEHPSRNLPEASKHQSINPPINHRHVLRRPEVEMREGFERDAPGRVSGVKFPPRFPSMIPSRTAAGRSTATWPGKEGGGWRKGKKAGVTAPALHALAGMAAGRDEGLTGVVLGRSSGEGISSQPLNSHAHRHELMPPEKKKNGKEGSVRAPRHARPGGGGKIRLNISHESFVGTLMPGCSDRCGA